MSYLYWDIFIFFPRLDVALPLYMCIYNIKYSWGYYWDEPLKNIWTGIIMVSLFQLNPLHPPSKKIFLLKSCNQIISMYGNMPLFGDWQEQFSSPYRFTILLVTWYRLYKIPRPRKAGLRFLDHIFKCIFKWNLFPRVHLTISYQWLR